MKQGSRTRRYILVAIKLLVAVALLVWLARSGHLDLGVIRSAGEHWPWLLAAQFVFGLVQWLTAVRWRWLLQAVGVDCGILRVFQITLAGLFFNQVLIGSTGGDVYRVLAFRLDEAERRIMVVASVVVDRLLGLYAMILVIPPTVYWNRSLIGQSRIVDLVVVGCFVAVILMPLVGWILYRLARGTSLAATSRLSRWLDLARQSLQPYHGQRALFVRSLVVSLLAQILIVVFNVMLAFSILGTDIPWPAFFLLVPIAMLGMAVPINPPGALGTGEAMYVYLLGMVGVAQGGVISLLQRFTTILWALPGALAFALPAPSGERYNEPTTEKENGSA